MAVYGYARARVQPALLAQEIQLRAAGCDTVVSDMASSRELRDGWQRLVEAAITGDTIRVVGWSSLTGNPTEYRLTVRTLAARGVRVEALGGPPPF
ncbi:recombinase family protein [Pseudonocardia sp.]|jgi:DNA invertase Pin-like site-specific DNA recombinase|uniref:recombinase family protein n=1 Tax=Pseudonocardia sp. TaxID=60912 RepID=UPI002DB0C07F|nr:recombinase family protein [Pseudonocardia sp.]